MARKFGFSFSAKRAVGISALKGRVAKATGVPTTRSGRQRKVGKAAGGCCVLVAGALAGAALAGSAALALVPRC